MAGSSKPTTISGEDQGLIWLKEKRRQARFTRLVFAGLVIVTIIIVVLNAMVVMSASLRPYYLQVRHNFGGAAGSGYCAYMQWKLPPEVGAAMHPKLLLDEQTVVPTDSALAIAIDLSRTYELSFLFDENCSEGEHRGVLRLIRISDNEDLPGSCALPINIGLSGSIWHNWIFVRYWLYLVGLLYVVMYIASLLAFPRPTGRLVFESPLSTTGLPPKHLRLRMPWSGLLMPWKRNVLPIARLWRKARVGEKLRFTGNLVFIERELPVLCELKFRGGARVYSNVSHALDARRLDLEYAREARHMATMYPSTWFAYQSSPQSGAIVLFHYEKSRT